MRPLAAGEISDARGPEYERWGEARNGMALVWGSAPKSPTYFRFLETWWRPFEGAATAKATCSLKA